MIAEAVYVLCGVTSLACASLLARQYVRTRVRLLFWSAACFAGLTVGNALLFLDFVTYPNVSLAVWRGGVTVVSLMLLLYGLVWEAR